MSAPTTDDLKNHCAEIDRQYLANVHLMHAKMSQLLQAQQKATEELMALRERVHALRLAMLSRGPARAPDLPAKPPAAARPRLAKLPPLLPLPALAPTTPCPDSSARAGRAQP